MMKEGDDNNIATKKIVSGGACFSPRVEPRPKYPTKLEILKAFLLSALRQPIMLAVLTQWSFPMFLKLTKYFKNMGYDDSKLFMIFGFCIHTITYVSINGFFLACDKFKWFQEYKLFRKPAQEPSNGLIKKALTEAFVSQFILGPLILYKGFSLFQYFGMQAHDAPLVSFWELVRTFSAAKLLNSVLFYWAHRICHHKALYKTLHKQHHEFVGTMGISAEYAGPVEQVLANQGPTLIGCLLFAKNPIVLYMWLLARLEETYEAHSGYCLANTFLHKIGLTNAEHAAFHDYHHTVNRGNFGEMWIDAFFGTMDGYLTEGGFDAYVVKGKKLAE